MKNIADKKAFLNWSSGKDATMALYEVQNIGQNEISLLLTTINSKHQRVSMHGLHRSLLEAQADAIGLPLKVIELDENATMKSYNSKMSTTLLELRGQGYIQSYFGDIFLEDLRKYRESMLLPLGFQAKFPLWKKNTKQLVQKFIKEGFRAIVICINAEVLDKSFCGRLIDQSFLDDLPIGVDPCGENGEFHTFCFDGPVFAKPVYFKKGDIVYKTYPAPKSEKSNGKTENGYWFCDLEPIA
ncbi:diphthine--ammonia ligase [uncultured Croceitalea sp.]|uniref:Dph6-related ATP pyrophosphatase n=1 Tax=uncultured Croceitalea sp. TaxID=1798908 RepID=UPI003306694E